MNRFSNSDEVPRIEGHIGGRMPTRWIEVNGVQLRYDYLPGPSLAVVLVHEMGGMLESWDDIIPLLFGKVTLLRYDQRGAGLSEKPRTSFAIGDAADDLAMLAETLLPDIPIVVVGAAVGGAIAATFAARHPDKIKALILLAPATGLADEKLAAAKANIDKLEQSDVRRTFPGKAWIDLSRFERIRLAADPTSLAATWRMLADLKMDEVLRAISCPTLVLGGRHDTARPPDHLAGVAAQIAHARFEVLEAGHILAMDAPERVASVILSFLEECLAEKNHL